MKLTRDYKWVETKYKNVQLDAKKKWNMVDMERRRLVEEEQRRHLEEGLDHDNARLQMQLRDDVSLKKVGLLYWYLLLDLTKNIFFIFTENS